MASGAQLRTKIAAKLSAIQACPRTVKFRQETRTGGNPRLGIGGTVEVTDTLADPQPAAQMLTAEEIAGTGGLLMPGDWEFVFAGTISEDTARTPHLPFGT